MWYTYIYVVLVNGKLAKIATMDPNLFLVLQHSCAGVDMSKMAPNNITTITMGGKGQLCGVHPKLPHFRLFDVAPKQLVLLLKGQYVYFPSI